MTSPVYWHPILYSAFMRLIYGRYYLSRYQSVADLIPEHRSVFDVCSGDCRIYTHYLKNRDVRYSCCDINPRFIKHARRRGISAQYLDVETQALPKADIVLMQASLYQFIPNHKAILEKLLGAAGQQVLLSEPIRNLATARAGVVAMIAQFGANPGNRHALSRFTEETFDEFIAASYNDRVERSFRIDGGREKVYVLKGG